MVNYEQILSARVKEVQPSGIRRFFELAAKMPARDLARCGRAGF